MKNLFRPLIVLASASLLGCLTASADTITVNTGGTASATYGPFTAGGGPFPFSNFGVQANASLGGAGVNLSLGGSSSFDFPTFTNGQVLYAGDSSFGIGYAPNWTGSISSSSSFTANAGFHYDIGPFSGDRNIYSQNLTASSAGSLASGGGLTGGSASGTTSGTPYHFGLSESAILASASVGIDIGANYQTGVNWNPTAQYGVSTWVSTAPHQGPSGTPAFDAVSSGALNYTFAAPGGGAIPGEQLYLNFEPGVRLNMPVTPSSNLSAPVSGNLHVSAFGGTLVDYSFPIGNLFNLPVNYDEWDVTGDWNAGYAFSIPVELENGSANGTCQNRNENCVEYVVDGNPFTFVDTSLGNQGPSNFTGGSNGQWNSLLNNTPLVPDACNPSTGTCYASNDPNMPVGTGTVTYTDTAVPEPGALPLLTAGLAALLSFCEYRRRKLLARAPARRKS